jgi:hypothetical protein
VLQAGRRPGPAAATCRESPPRKSRPCPPPTTPLPMTVARRRRMIKDHYVPRRNQSGQRLLGAQRSQLPPAVHQAPRPAAASPRSAGSEMHPARQRAAGWARCLRDPCPGIARMARYVNAARQVPAVSSGRFCPWRRAGQAGHQPRPGRPRRWPYGPGCCPTAGLGTSRWYGDSRCPPWLRLSPGTAHQAAGARTTLVQPLSRASKCW